MYRLHVRLTLVFLAILLVLGAFCLWLARSSAALHSLELTQRLNEPVADYLVDTRRFADAEGLRGDALAELAPHVMTINPSIQVYLLNLEGEVVAQAAEFNSIASRRVSLEPIRRFLAGDVTYPLMGDDPADGDSRRPFSAAPVRHGERLLGYVYVVLGDAPFASLRESLGSSRATRDVALMLSGALLFAAIAGTLVFFTLTRRLRELIARVEHQGTPGETLEHRGVDEIDELAAVYGDLTDRLQAQYAKLAQSDADRRRLIASVSHDLRTPLTTLRGFIETLQLEDAYLDEAQRQHFLGTALRHADRLGARVDELFELSRLTTEGMTLQPESFSLRELAHDCVQDFALRASERAITLEVLTDASDEDDTFLIEADIALIQRVFDNLIDNALRHTDRAGHIAIGLRRASHGAIRIDVCDSGCGMPPEVAGRVLESRWTGSANDHARGGLGLTIVARAVHLHGGTIDVSSQLGVGTCFRLELPSLIAVPPKRLSVSA